MHNQHKPPVHRSQTAPRTRTGASPLPVQRTPVRPAQPGHPMQNRRSSQNERVPAVSTLKSGGPRLHEPAHPAAPQKKKLSPYERQRRRSQMREYLFGLAVGLIFFGIAAIFVCQALIGIFT